MEGKTKDRLIFILSVILMAMVVYFGCMWVNINQDQRTDLAPYIAEQLQFEKSMTKQERAERACQGDTYYDNCVRHLMERE